MSNTRRGDQFKNAARGGLIPIGVLLGAAWIGLNCMEGDLSAYTTAAVLLRSGIIATGVYGLVVFFVSISEVQHGAD